MSDPIEREKTLKRLLAMADQTGLITTESVEYVLASEPPAQPEPFVDADKLKRCRFEYINACKILAHRTPDTSKNDIYDAHAVIKALHPIFGDVEF